MKKKVNSKTRLIVKGGVANYIAKCPKEIQAALEEIRTIIRSAAPGAVETLSYFGMPGYSYEGYPYNGMFAWFSFKASYLRLHVRPKALERYSKDVGNYATTKAIISFPAEKPIPRTLIKKLVLASVSDMKKDIGAG